jgi:uncharacterized protein YeaO (DUF488 family)
MAIRVVRLGSPRAKDEGPRLGTVRRPPRGVAKKEFAARDFYDVWLPELAPTAALVSWALATPWTDARWRQFEKRYRAEMSKPAAHRLIQTLAALSHGAHFSVGCYCDDPRRCHRSLLAQVLRDAGAHVTPQS